MVALALFLVYPLAMPFRSQAQRKLMYAVLSGKAKADVPRSVAQEFVESDVPGKLPEHAPKRAYPNNVKRPR